MKVGLAGDGPSSLVKIGVDLLEVFTSGSNCRSRELRSFRANMRCATSWKFFHGTKPSVLLCNLTQDHQTIKVTAVRGIAIAQNKYQLSARARLYVFVSSENFC